MGAHKVVLSASSIFFRNVLKNNKNTSSLLYIRGLTNIEHGNVVEFLYKGEVTVEQENLEHFLRLSKDLKLKGLYENDEVNDKELTNDTFKETPKQLDVKKRQKKDKHHVKVENEEFNDEKSECIDASSFQAVEFLQSPASDVENHAISDFEAKVSKMIFRENKMWHCKACDVSDKKKGNIRRHVDTRHLDVLQSCNLCDVVTKNKPLLAYHMKTKHSKSNALCAMSLD